MSFAVYARVLKLKVGNATAKLILLGLAEHSHDDGTAAFPSTNLLATYGECSTRTVHRHLDYLRKHGFIRRGDQRFVQHVRSDRRPIVYEVAVSDALRQAWATESDKIYKTSQAGRRDNPRGDKLSPRKGQVKPQVDRHDILSPRPRGDTGDVHGVTQLCHTNPPKEPSPSSGGGEGGGGFENDPVDASVDSFVAELPGKLTIVQRNRIAKRVNVLVNGGWSLDDVHTELTTDVGTAGSLGAVYQYRLRHLPANPPEKSANRPAPVGPTHAFVEDSDDPGWCIECHKPAANATHATQSIKQPEVASVPTPGTFNAAEATLAA